MSGPSSRTAGRRELHLFLEAHARVPREIVLDLDNTDIPLHGAQGSACARSSLASVFRSPPTLLLPDPVQVLTDL
jgi:hypothetical protein